MYEPPCLPWIPRADCWFWLDDSPETFKNAPVALQLVGQCQEDEAVIAMTEIVDAALKAKQK